MSDVGADLSINELNIKKSHSTNDLERTTSPLPSPSTDLAASLSKLLILSNPNLRKSQPLDACDSSSTSESPTIDDQHINLVVPPPASSSAGGESNLF
jgi:hypothetical protein